MADDDFLKYLDVKEMEDFVYNIIKAFDGATKDKEVGKALAHIVYLGIAKKTLTFLVGKKLNIELFEIILQELESSLEFSEFINSINENVH